MYQDMVAELRGTVPKIPDPFCETLINRAWGTVRDMNLWSFQLWEGQWIAPAQFTDGACSVTQGLNTVTLDATASTNLPLLLAQQPFSLITQRQFRITSGDVLSGIYNIWGYDDTTTPGTVVLSLDRPFAETTSASVSFTIYQCYYAPQRSNGAAMEYLPDFRSWVSVRDMQHFINLDTETMTRADLDRTDPQRLLFFMPTRVVPYQTEQNPASAQRGQFLFELWGHPIGSTNLPIAPACYVYQLLGERRGLDLVAPTDTLPFAVGEDCVMALAKVYAYQWGESRREVTTDNRSGPDYRFLSGASQKEFDGLLRKYRQRDRDVVDNWFSVRRGTPPHARGRYYNSISGTANPGGAP